MILWFEVIITRENSFTKGQWNKGKKALFSMILISFFFSLSVLFLSLILCPLWVSFDHGSWDWSWFAGVPILAFDQPKSNHVQRVITGSLHRWLKFITLLDFDSIIAKFFYTRGKTYWKWTADYWLCITTWSLGDGGGRGGGLGHNRPEIVRLPWNPEHSLEAWAFNCTLQPYSRLV